MEEAGNKVVLLLIHKRGISKASKATCFSRRFPQVAQNTFNEGGHSLLTHE